MDNGTYSSKDETAKCSETIGHKYPLKMQSTTNDVVVEFTGLMSGAVIKHHMYKVGYTQDEWIEHTDTNHWKPHIEPAEEKPFQLEVGKTYVTHDGKGKGTVLCVDLKNKFSCVVRIIHPVFGDIETIRQYKKDGNLFDIDSDALDLVALYNPLANVKKWTPIWVRDSEGDSWSIRMFFGASDIGKVKAATSYGSDCKFWNFYTLTQPEVSE